MAAPNDGRQPGGTRSAGKGGRPPGTGKSFAVEEPDEQPLVRVTIYRKKQLKKETMTWEQSQQLPISDVDLYVNMVSFRVIVRRPDGTLLEHKRRINKIGMTVFAVVLKLLRKPGFYMDSYEIGRMLPYYDSHGECLESYICRIRKHVFGENDKTQYFILSGPGLSYAFNGDLSFCLIEKVISS